MKKRKKRVSRSCDETEGKRKKRKNGGGGLHKNQRNSFYKRDAELSGKPWQRSIARKRILG